MLDIKYIRNNPEAVIENCRNRNVTVDIPHLLELDEKSRLIKNELDAIRQRRNEISQQMKGKLSPEDRQALIEEAKQLRPQESEKEAAYEAVNEPKLELLVQVPNLTHPDSPIGTIDEENVTIRQVGEIPKFDFEPKDHLELMESLDLIDFEGGAKVAGNKFYYFKNEAVFLEFALMQYGLKVLQAKGFTPFITPDMARLDILSGTGYNPRGEESQIYAIEGMDLGLIATAEITLAGRLANTMLSAEELPLLHAGVSHCYRREAGAAGQESRGMYRVHQFTKLEMFMFTHPDDSEAMHQKLLAIEERIFQDLEIPYRVVDICTGDLGGPAYRKYDLEAWLPGRNKWGEITSASNCTDYQSRRLNIRFKDKVLGKNRFAHMLNGTAIANSRAIVALMENGQQADGSIKLPKCLGMPDIVPK